MKQFLRLCFALWVGASSAEDAVYGGVRRLWVCAAVCVPLAAAAVFARTDSAWQCVSALCCFIGAEKIARRVRAAESAALSVPDVPEAMPGQTELPALGAADVCAIGSIALLTGTLWIAAGIIASALCLVHCALTKKRRAAFIPFLNAGAVLGMALGDAGMLVHQGGLLYD
jgi:prepilin signal peptidase PulO-like enzyme (type II secretory pathway)